MTPQTPDLEKLLWDISEVSAATGLSPSTIRLRVCERTFPRPRKGGQGSKLRWMPKDIEDWVRKREVR